MGMASNTRELTEVSTGTYLPIYVRLGFFPKGTRKSLYDFCFTTVSGKFLYRYLIFLPFLFGWLKIPYLSQKLLLILRSETRSLSSFHLFTNIIVPLITQVFFYGGTGPVKSVVVKKNYVLEPAKIPISGHLAYHCFDGLSLIKKRNYRSFLNKC